MPVPPPSIEGGLTDALTGRKIEDSLLQSDSSEVTGKGEGLGDGKKVANATPKGVGLGSPANELPAAGTGTDTDGRITDAA